MKEYGLNGLAKYKIPKYFILSVVQLCSVCPELHGPHLIGVFHPDLHNVVEDHEVADLVDIAHDGQTSDNLKRNLSKEIDDLENYKHHGEHDVGLDEALSVLPDPVDGEGGEDHPDDSHHANHGGQR